MNKYRTFAWTALLMGLVVLLGMTPIGIIPLGFINVTILCLPVIIGALLTGLRAGMVLGLGFAGVSIFRLITSPSTLAGTLYHANPLLGILMSLIPRLVFPALSYVVYHLILKSRWEGLAAALAAVAGSAANTVLYLGLMLLFYQMIGLLNQATVSLILSIAGTAGVAEAVAAGLLVPPVLFALQKVNEKV